MDSVQHFITLIGNAGIFRNYIKGLGLIMKSCTFKNKASFSSSDISSTSNNNTLNASLSSSILNHLFPIIWTQVKLEDSAGT